MTALDVGIAEIPTPPNENRRLHWSARAKREKEWRDVASTTARVALRLHGGADDFPIERATLEYVFLLTAARGDLDNLVAACKPLVDGLRDAGIIRDDSVGRLVSISARWQRADRRGVVLRIREAG